MTTDDDGQADTRDGAQAVAIEVPMSSELLRAIDEFATHNGYETPDAVVCEALARAREQREDEE